MTSDVRAWLATLSKEKRNYVLKNVLSHSAKAGKTKKLFQFLTNFDFIEAKISAFKTRSLIKDYQLALDPAIKMEEQQADILKTIQATLRLSEDILDHNSSQLVGHLLGRLLFSDVPEIQALLELAKTRSEQIWLRPLTSSLTSPFSPLIRTLIGHKDEIITLAITPDGQQLISGSEDQTIKVWNWKTGEELYTLTGHTGSVLTLAVTPDGKNLISGSEDQTIKVWDLTTGKQSHTLTGHTGSVLTLAIYNNDILFSSSEDHTIKIWSIEMGQGKELLEFPDSSVLSLCLIPEKQKLIFGLDTGYLGILSLNKLSKIKVFFAFDDLEKDPVTLKFCELTPENPENIEYIDAKFQDSYFILEHKYINKALNAESIFLCTDNEESYYGHGSSKIGMFNFKTKNYLYLAGGYKITDLKFSHNGNILVYSSVCNVYGIDSYIEGVDPKNGKRLFIINDNSISKSLAITPDGNYLFSGSDNIRVRNLKRVIELNDRGDKNIIKNINLSPNKNFLMINCDNNDQAIPHYIYCLKTGKKYFDSFCQSVRFSSSGQILIIKADETRLNKSTFMYGLYSLKQEKYFFDLSSKADIECYFDDGARITHDETKIIYTLKNAIEIYDLKTQNLLFAISGEDQKILQVEQTLNGKHLIAVFEDATIKVWNINTRQQTLTFLNHFLKAKNFFSKENDDKCLLKVSVVTSSGMKINNSPTIETITPNSRFCISRSRIICSEKQTFNHTIIWNLETGKEIFSWHERFLAVTPDSKKAIFTSHKTNLAVIDLESGTFAHTLKGYTAPIEFAKVTEDSKRMISVDQEGVAKAWDLETGEEICTFTEHSTHLQGITIASNSRQVISICNEKVLTLWELETGKVLSTFIGESNLTCCTWLPDDVTVAVGDRLGQVHFLRLEGIPPSCQTVDVEILKRISI